MLRKLLLWGLCLVSLELEAQTVISLDSITVSSTRIPLKISETGRNISVITSEQIRQMPYTSLDELLQYIPGVEVQSRNAFGAQGDITMRGSTFTQVLLLIDGMKLNDPLTSHFNSYIPVAPDEIERIEVLRGAAAAQYGADAVGGVIHIITKGFSESKEEHTQVSGDLNLGEHSLILARQGFSYRKNGLYLGGGFNFSQSDGEQIPERSLGEDANLEAFRNFFDIKTVAASFGYAFDNGWNIRARSAYDYRDYSARFFYTSSPLDKSVETTRHFWNQLRVDKQGEKSQSDFQVVYKYNTDEFVFSPDFPSTNEHTTQFLNFNINHLQKINENLEIQGGIQADYRQIRSNDRGDHEDWHYGLYTSAIIRPGTRWNINPSIRVDYDQNYDWELTPQLNVSYILPGAIFRASAGRSIRAADYTERYVSNNLQNLSPGRNLGNPDLSAERSWSEEIGLDVYLKPRWILKTTGFFRQSSELVDFIQTNEEDIPRNQNLQDSANYFFAQNVSDVRTRGVELESWSAFSLGQDSELQVTLGYTFIKTTNDEDVISVYISSHARHLLTINLILNHKSLELALNGVYKVRNRQFAEGIGADLARAYNLWNFRLGYRIHQNFGLNFQIHNIWNEDYQDILGAQMPGRWVLGGIRFQL